MRAAPSQNLAKKTAPKKSTPTPSDDAEIRAESLASKPQPAPDAEPMGSVGGEASADMLGDEDASYGGALRQGTASGAGAPAPGAPTRGAPDEVEEHAFADDASAKRDKNKDRSRREDKAAEERVETEALATDSRSAGRKSQAAATPAPAPATIAEASEPPPAQPDTSWTDAQLTQAIDNPLSDADTIMTAALVLGTRQLERGDLAQARRTVDKGLDADGSTDLRTRLEALSARIDNVPEPDIEATEAQ